VVREKLPLMELRHVLARYECRHVDLSGTATPHQLLDFLVHQDRPEALADALAVTAAYRNVEPRQAYVARALYLVRNHRVRVGLSLTLNGLPHTESQGTYWFVACFVAPHLNSFSSYVTGMWPLVLLVAW
jgi:hypothetical protein